MIALRVAAFDPSEVVTPMPDQRSGTARTFKEYLRWLRVRRGLRRLFAKPPVWEDKP